MPIKVVTDPYEYTGEWFETFGSYLPTRPELGQAQVAMIEDCLDRKTTVPYEAWLDSLPKERDY